MYNHYIHTRSSVLYMGRGIVDLFMVIKDLVVLKKLQSSQPVTFVNGAELVAHLEPKGTGFAYYQLMPYRDSLAKLEKHGWIKKEMRNSPPYGYGDDEQYHLTPLALQTIAELKNNDAIKSKILESLVDFDFWNTNSYSDD